MSVPALSTPKEIMFRILDTKGECTVTIPNTDVKEVIFKFGGGMNLFHDAKNKQHCLQICLCRNPFFVYDIERKQDSKLTKLTSVEIDGVSIVVDTVHTRSEFELRKTIVEQKIKLWWRAISEGDEKSFMDEFVCVYNTGDWSKRVLVFQGSNRTLVAVFGEGRLIEFVVSDRPKQYDVTTNLIFMILDPEIENHDGLDDWNDEFVRKAKKDYEGEPLNGTVGVCRWYIENHYQGFKDMKSGEKRWKKSMEEE